MHFFRWTIGDGQLLQLYPQHTYYSLPNVAECMLATALSSPVLVFVFHAWLGEGLCLASLRCLVLTLGILVSEMLSDISKHCLFDRTRVLELKGFSRCVAAAGSSLVICTLELGRLWGHLKRGMLLQSVLRRFDWHCGEMSGAVPHERKVARWKFAAHISVAVGLQVGLGFMLRMPFFRQG
jgi:hypothetical protein